MEALTSAQKAAIIISSIGTENASEVFKHFSDEEVEQITLEIARMNYYPMEVVDSVLNEFYELCLTQKVISEGGVEYARDILEKAFGPQTAQALFEKITKQFQTKAFAFVRKADYKNLLAMVQNEHPQTIALILSYARSDQASAILSELPSLSSQVQHIFIFFDKLNGRKVTKAFARSVIYQGNNRIQLFL